MPYLLLRSFLCPFNYRMGIGNCYNAYCIITNLLLPLKLLANGLKLIHLLLWWLHFCSQSKYSIRTNDFDWQKQAFLSCFCNQSATIDFSHKQKGQKTTKRAQPNQTCNLILKINLVSLSSKLKLDAFIFQDAKTYSV